MDDLFIPEGYVPLTSALDQLAQAWQTPLQAAQTRLRSTLHEGWIVAYALEQSTGRNIAMISNSWATKWGQRWLENGTCMLPDEDGDVRITAEPFDMFYQPENAPIVISQLDLWRLIDLWSHASGQALTATPPIHRRTPFHHPSPRLPSDTSTWRKGNSDQQVKRPSVLLNSRNNGECADGPAGIEPFVPYRHCIQTAFLIKAPSRIRSCAGPSAIGSNSRNRSFPMFRTLQF